MYQKGNEVIETMHHAPVMIAKDYSANMAPPIPLFLAVTSGPRTIQKYTLNSWDPCITIWQLGASIMGLDVHGSYPCRGVCSD